MCNPRHRRDRFHLIIWNQRISRDRVAPDLVGFVHQQSARRAQRPVGVSDAILKERRIHHRCRCVKTFLVGRRQRDDLPQRALSDSDSDCRDVQREVCEMCRYDGPGIEDCPMKMSMLSSSATRRFSTAISWLPVPRSPLTDQVSRIFTASGGNSIARISEVPGKRPGRGFPFSVTTQLPMSQLLCWHPLANAHRPLTMYSSPRSSAVPRGAKPPPAMRSGPAA